MEFKEALQRSLKEDKHTHADPFLLHSRVSDLVGNDCEAKKAAEEFYRLDAKYDISKVILAAAPVRYEERAKHRYRIKSMPTPPDNAYVYFSLTSPTLHLSGECPCLRHAEQIFRATYDCARTKAYKKRHLSGRSLFMKIGYYGSVTRRALQHHPPVCRVCGTFTPKTTTSPLYKLTKWLYDRLHLDLRRKICYKSTL